MPFKKSLPTYRYSLQLPLNWITVFLVGTDLFIMSPFLPLIGREINVPPESLTVLVSAFSLTYALACPIQGRVSERWGLRTVLVTGVVSLALANFFTAMASNTFQLTLSRESPRISRRPVGLS